MTDTTHYKPESVSPPGETLLELLEDTGLSQAELAARTGVTPKHINGIIKGRAPISPAVAISLEQVLEVPARFWITRESRYQEHLARLAWCKKMQQHVKWARSFPVKKMTELRYISGQDTDLGYVQELLKFFRISSPQHWHEKWDALQPSFRISTKHEPNRFALSAWLCQGQRIAESIDCQAFDMQAFKDCVQTIRTLTTKEPEEFQPQLEATCAKCGVAVVFVPELPKTHVSGATRWIGEIALIQLSLRYKTNDMLWFAFFHEACHVLKHHKRNTYLRDATRDPDDEIEEQANRWAADILIPPHKYSEFARDRLSKPEIRQFAKSVGVAPGIVAGRLQHDGYLPFTYCNDLKIKYEWKNI